MEHEKLRKGLKSLQVEIINYGNRSQASPLNEKGAISISFPIRIPEL